MSNPQLLATPGAACGSDATAILSGDQAAGEWRSDVAVRHDQRKLITGTICLQVQYKDAELPAEDVFALHYGGGGRIFVEELRACGQAFRSGVRPGDELTRIKVGRGRAVFPADGAQCLTTLKTLATPLDAGIKGPSVVLFFMGFAGKYPAEVRVTSHPEERLGHFGVQELVGQAPFKVCEEVVLRPHRAPLLLVPRKLPVEPHRVLRDGRHVEVWAESADHDLFLEATCGSQSSLGEVPFEADAAAGMPLQAQPQGVLELEQVAAKKLLRKAALELSYQGYPALAAWARSRPFALLNGEESPPPTAMDEVLDVLLGRPGEASRSSLGLACEGVPASEAPQQLGPSVVKKKKTRALAEEAAQASAGDHSPPVSPPGRPLPRVDMSAVRLADRRRYRVLGDVEAPRTVEAAESVEMAQDRPKVQTPSSIDGVPISQTTGFRLERPISKVYGGIVAQDYFRSEDFTPRGDELAEPSLQRYIA